MKNLFKSALITFGILILLLAVTLFGFIWFTKPKVTILESALSPDGALVARKTKTGDPEAEGISHRITLENRNQLMGSDQLLGNIYRYDQNSCLFDFELKWESNDTLVIYYPDTATVDIHQNEMKLGGRSVHIELHPTARSQWHLVSNYTLPPCSVKKLKTTDWETQLE